ncbi:hypothetical protein BC834DRAFT_852393 [Gloeopeniophorella convolvens]|nr:hypothetical protein BC834DRAFT_852393 [Gloeopeniophorella convolvens]
MGSLGRCRRRRAGGGRRRAPGVRCVRVCVPVFFLGRADVFRCAAGACAPLRCRFYLRAMCCAVRFAIRPRHCRGDRVKTVEDCISSLLLSYAAARCLPASLFNVLIPSLFSSVCFFLALPSPPPPLLPPSPCAHSLFSSHFFHFHFRALNHYTHLHPSTHTYIPTCSRTAAELSMCIYPSLFVWRSRSGCVSA